MVPLFHRKGLMLVPFGTVPKATRSAGENSYGVARLNGHLGDGWGGFGLFLMAPDPEGLSQGGFVVVGRWNDIVITGVWLAASFVGLGWMCIFLVPLGSGFIQRGTVDVIALVLLSTLSFPGLLLLSFGVRLSVRRTALNIRGTVGSFCLLGTFIASTYLQDVTDSPRELTKLWIGLCGLCFLLVYIFGCRYLLARAGAGSRSI